MSRDMTFEGHPFPASAGLTVDNSLINTALHRMSPTYDDRSVSSTAPAVVYLVLSVFETLSKISVDVIRSTIRYDTIEEINVDSKAEYTA